MMKNPLIFSLILLLNSCSSDDLLISTDLKGEWNWKSTCGGFAGCFYASKTDSRKLTIDGTSIVLKENGGLALNDNYSILARTDTAQVTTYLIKVGNQRTWMMKISNNNLTVLDPTIGLTSVYKRIK